MSSENIKVGDRVLVTHKTGSEDPNGMGLGLRWDNAWTHGMDAAIGEEFTVTELHGELGVAFQTNMGGFGPHSYMYPLASLQKVEVAVEQ